MNELMFIIVEVWMKRELRVGAIQLMAMIWFINLVLTSSFTSVMPALFMRKDKVIDSN